MFPAASRAMAVTVCGPLGTAAVLQLTENGNEVSSLPTFAPSTWKRTPTTRTLSVAEAERVVVPVTDAPAAGLVTATAGGVVSGTGLLTVTVRGAETAWLAAASRATAVIVQEPFCVWFVVTEIE